MDPISWGAAIKALFVMIPKLIDLVGRLSKMAADKAFQDWVDELDVVTRKLETAKTLQERVDAARALSRLTRGL